MIVRYTGGKANIRTGLYTNPQPQSVSFNPGHIDSNYRTVPQLTDLDLY